MSVGDALHHIVTAILATAIGNKTKRKPTWQSAGLDQLCNILFLVQSGRLVPGTPAAFDSHLTSATTFIADSRLVKKLRGGQDRFPFSEDVFMAASNGSFKIDNSTSHFSSHKHVGGYRVDNDLSRINSSNKSYSTEVIALRQKLLAYETEIQDNVREIAKWKRKCSELDRSQQDLQLQYESKYVPSLTASFASLPSSNMAKHDEALNMISLLQAENESLKQQLNKSQTTSMYCTNQDIFKLSVNQVLNKVFVDLERLSLVESKSSTQSTSSTGEIESNASIQDQNAIEAAYHDAVLMATSFREPTDKLVSNINATVEALERELQILEQNSSDNLSPSEKSSYADFKTADPMPKVTKPDVINLHDNISVAKINDLEIMSESSGKNDKSTPRRLVQSKSAINLKAMKALQDSRMNSSGQELKYNSASALEQVTYMDNGERDVRLSLPTPPLRSSSCNSSPDVTLNKTPSPRPNLSSHFLHRKRKSIADLKMEGVWRNDQFALRPSASLSTSELALRAETVAAQAMAADIMRDSSTSSREGGRRRTVSSVYGYDVSASSGSFQQMRTITPPPSPKQGAIHVKPVPRSPKVHPVCAAEEIPRANIDFEAMRHRSSMGGEYIQFQTSLSGGRRASMVTPKALPKAPSTSVSTPYSTKNLTSLDAPVPTPSASKSKWTKRRVVSAIFKDSVDLS
ncbi:hypothetical protein NQZ79_g7610 [Umbelopsis isabellina]|nr:hypothetical protein NQZ79_g7610 [Umbelopsis isabellina]